MKPTSLRELKKNETRQAIIDAATGLYLSVGYDKTTLADIAAEAHVSQRTIFTYFPSKEAIIFYKGHIYIDSFFEELEKPSDTSIIDRLTSMQIDKQETAEDEALRELIIATPVLYDYSINLLGQLEKRLVDLISKEQALPADSIQAHLLAAACRATFDYQMNHPALDRDGKIALRFIKAGLEATT